MRMPMAPGENGTDCFDGGAFDIGT